MGLRSPMETILPGERTFAIASTKKALEEGDTPPKLRNIVGTKKSKSQEGSK